jgi:hypothetical protein
MNMPIITRVHRLLRLGLLLAAASLATETGYSSKLVLQMDIHQAGSAAGGNLGYFAFSFLSTTDTPITYDEVYSAQTNFLGGVGPGSTTFGAGFGTLGDMVNALTNGQWTLVINAGDPSQQIYKFSMSAADLTTNTFPAVQVTFPTNGSLYVTNNPLFTWTGTNNWPEVDVDVHNGDYSFDPGTSLSAAATNWNAGPTLNDGTNYFDVTYFISNAPSILTVSTPTNGLGQSPAGWVATNQLFAGDSSQFTVGSPVLNTSGGEHTLVAHYTFDDPNNIGTDSSGNGNDFNAGGGQNGGGAQGTSDAEAGGGAIDFFRNDSDYYSAGYQGWTPSTPGEILSALQGSFSVSVWVKTTASIGSLGDYAYNGSAVIAADVGGHANDMVPIALTGGQVAFNTGGDEDDTLNSSGTVNDGSYHHIVVTRDQATGNKAIYIDGVLDSTGRGTTNLLNDPQSVVLGAIDDAGNPTLGGSAFYGGFDGEMDDLQIYSGVLNPTEVASLFNNPGLTVANGGGSSGGHKNVAHYAFDNSGNLGQDSSGNGNDMSGEVYWGPQHQFDTDATAGGGAVRFFGTDAIYPYDQVLTNLNAVLAGSFTFSAWIKTTVTNGADYNNAFYGAVIFWAYNDHGNTNDTIPLAITGSKAAFTTRDHLGNSTTLHSISTVNNGNYHLITVTRDQDTGEKKIYVDGNFEASEIGTTDPLNGNNYNLTIGGWAYILESDSTVTNYSSYNGLLDDVQIYTGVLSDTEVASLYANPGTTVPDVAGGSGGPVVHYDFDEGTVLATDVSGNNNNIVHAGNFGGSGPSIRSDTAAGSGSVSFDGGSYLTASSNLLSTLAGEFSVSLWLKTSQSFGSQNDYAWAGAGVIAADSPNWGAKDLIPVALTGGQVAFNVGDGISDDTLNSSATVNDNTWHHVVVTRSLSPGERQIFIDGTLDSSKGGSTTLLNSPVLLTIGAKSDASDPDPASPDNNGSNGYEGLLDDVQIYNRVLSPDEVAFLYQNPGATITISSSTPYPVDVCLQLTIVRSQDPNIGEYFSAGVLFNSVNPAPTTTNSVHSPHDFYSAEQYPSGNGAIFNTISSSLDDVLHECTNGLWKIYINQNSPTQQVYSFQVSISGLDTNLLQAVTVFSPTNGAVNVATNPMFYWAGPTNFSTLQIELLSGPVAFPPVTATNWPSPPTLNYGSDRFDVDYNSTNFPGVTFTTPVDASSNPVRTWTTTVILVSESFNNFVVGAPAPLPVLITNLTQTSGNLQFSFETLAGRPHIIEARTNLATGIWVPLTNFIGDGSLKQFTLPATNPPIQFFRVNTQ